MRKLLMLLIAIAFAMPAKAQIQAESERKGERMPIGVGIKVGGNLPKYHYDEKDLNDLPMDTLKNRVRLTAGVQVELPINDNLLFTPELIYTSKGDRRVYRNKPSGAVLTYEAKVNYLDLRLPLTYVVPVKGKLKPYVFAGLDAAMVLPYIKTDSVDGINLSGTLSQVNEVEVNKSNMAPFDVSVFGGLGLRYTVDFNRFSLVMKLEADYNFGLLNTYSKDEIASQVPAANLGLGTHYILGTRKNQGLEAFFTVLLPLKFYRDACVFGTSRVNKGKKGQLYGF